MRRLELQRYGQLKLLKKLLNTRQNYMQALSEFCCGVYCTIQARMQILSMYLLMIIAVTYILIHIHSSIVNSKHRNSRNLIYVVAPTHTHTLKFECCWDYEILRVWVFQKLHRDAQRNMPIFTGIHIKRQNYHLAQVAHYYNTTYCMQHNLLL